MVGTAAAEASSTSKSMEENGHTTRTMEIGEQEGAVAVVAGADKEELQVAQEQPEQPEEQEEQSEELVSPAASYATAETEDEEREEEDKMASTGVFEDAMASPVGPEAGEDGEEQQGPAAGNAKKEEEDKEEEEEEEAMEPVRVGEEVDTPWGVGKIVEVRPPVSNANQQGGAGGPRGVYVVEALQWRMAGGQAPTLFLQRKELTKLSPYVIYKWPTRKKIQRAAFLKASGNARFKAQDMAGAEGRYSEAVGVLQLATDQELSNEEKARKLEVLIPTLNNLGSARMKAQRFEQAYVVARSAYELLTELEKNKGGEVVKALKALGLTEEQLFGRSRRKAALMSGKALVELNEYGAAIAILEAAKQLEKQADPDFKSTDARQVLLLLQQAKTRKVAEERAEKAKWSKTFTRFSEEEAEAAAAAKEPKSTAATAPGVTPPVPAVAAAAVENKKENGAAAAAGGAGGAGVKKEGRPKKSRALARRAATPWWVEHRDLLFLGIAGATVLSGFAFLKLTAGRQQQRR